MLISTWTLHRASVGSSALKALSLVCRVQDWLGPENRNHNQLDKSNERLGPNASRPGGKMRQQHNKGKQHV